MAYRKQPVHRCKRSWHHQLIFSCIRIPKYSGVTFILLKSYKSQSRQASPLILLFVWDYTIVLLQRSWKQKCQCWMILLALISDHGECTHGFISHILLLRPSSLRCITRLSIPHPVITHHTNKPFLVQLWPLCGENLWSVPTPLITISQYLVIPIQKRSLSIKTEMGLY